MCLEDGLGLLNDLAPQTAHERLVSAADHHLHIQSEMATAEMRSVAQRFPDMFERLNSALLQPRDGKDALRVLDDAEIAQGVLLSEGYIFTSPFATPDLPDREELTRQENQFNVDAAIASRGRLKAFVGINPFCSFAHRELAHWAGREGVAGVKLHLGNSGFDPKSTDHIAMLDSFVVEARALNMPILIHARPPGSYDAADTKDFIDKVLRRADGLTIQIAHGGAGGGADDAAEALTHYAEAMEYDATALSGLIIDLSCVLTPDPSSAGGKAAIEGIVHEARRIGIERFVLGSDWPTLCTPREHDALLVRQLPFTASEWSIIAANRASYLD